MGITTVYVTHDQEEAMAISDRIAVMNAGVIQHVGRPKDIYQRPANLFVATFIGKSNILKGQVLQDDSGYKVNFADGYEVSVPAIDPAQARVGEALLSVRPEELLLMPTGYTGPGIRATIDDSVFLGLNTHYFVTLDSGEEAEIIQESQIDSILPPGSKIKPTVNTDKFNVFGVDDETSMMQGICNEVKAFEEEAVRK